MAIGALTGLLHGVRENGGVTKLVGARWRCRMQDDLAELNSRRCLSQICLSYHYVPLRTLGAINDVTWYVPRSPVATVLAVLAEGAEPAKQYYVTSCLVLKKIKAISFSTVHFRIPVGAAGLWVLGDVKSFWHDTGQ
jgi:hypothetical protein